MATINVLDSTGATVAIEKPLTPGAAAAASSRPVTLSTEDVARAGIITETAPATDTASSGLNGRLQRIAQRLTTLIALFPVGAGTAAAATRTTLASDDPVVAGVGAIADAAVTAGATGSVSAKLRLMSSQLDSIKTAVETLDNTVGGSELQVDVVSAAAVAAGENFIGSVGGKTAIPSITMTPDTAILASGDLIADTQQLDGAFRVTNGTGVLNTLTFFCGSDQKAQVHVFVHDTTTSMGTENSAPTISDANAAAGILGFVTIETTDYVDIGGTSVASIKNIGLPVKAVSGTDDLYFSVVNGSGTPTYGASSIILRPGILQD